jgi:hypothetical protein
MHDCATTTDPLFDGHPARDFATMTAEERLEDLSAKIALVLELRQARQEAAGLESDLDRVPA